MNRPVRLALALTSGVLLLVAAAFAFIGCRSQSTHADSSPPLGESASRPATPPRLEFTRMIAHWSGYANAGYLPFVDDAKPEIAQVGFYGAHFWSLVDTAHGGGYPAHLPLRGQRECGDWFERLNAELHRRGVKVVGHLNVKFLVGDPDSPEGPRGFFRFYRDLWDEQRLGPKPVANALDLLEKDRSGQPISNASYSIGGMREYWACLNNPHWRQVLKAWIRCGIARGVDGFVANYYYRHDCHCEHCVRGFRLYLRERFTTGELAQRFGITNVATQVFEEIVSWHDPAKSTPLRREMLRFSQLANKQAFDEVFITFGRSLKPDLIVAQWNHLGDFNQISGDERCLLPGAVWGRGEDYLWYSTGDAANHTDFAAGRLGEGTLQARYIRGAFDDKPFTLGKYEGVRIRAAIAELAANGGAPMGFYTSFEDPEARREIVRYYDFLRRHEDLYRANQPHGEVALLFPRSRVHQGDVAAVDRFKALGQRLLDLQVLFDVIPDDLPKTRRRQYAAVVDPADAGIDVSSLASRLPGQRSRFEAPFGVRVSASRPARSADLTLHFVNYNRQEPADKKDRGNRIKDEKPIAAPGIEVDLNLDPGLRLLSAEFLTPEATESRRLECGQSGQRVRFRVPEFLVYGVVNLHCSR